jgi:SAM-dependent methyltransferase
MSDTEPGRLNRTISPEDGVLQGNESRYFATGRCALRNILRALESAGLDADPPARILDFPCGHGRVLRYLRAAFPDAEITGCDLLRDAVDFCASQLGAIPVYSDPDPAKIPLAPDAFDLIWVGSLLTHLDAPLWIRFLPFFRDRLKRGGVLVFSTHGRQSHRLLASNPCYYLHAEGQSQIRMKYEATGFGYADYQNHSGYGVSLAQPHWVCRLITSVPELRLASVTEKSWDNHHDVYVCVRDPGWQARCTTAPDFPIAGEPHVGTGSLTTARPGPKRWWRRSA